MDGRFPISKAKSSHYCEKKWETLWHFVKYMSCSLSVLTGCGVTGAILRSSPSPPQPLGGSPRVWDFWAPFEMPNGGMLYWCVPAASPNWAAAPHFLSLFPPLFRSSLPPRSRSCLLLCPVPVSTPQAAFSVCAAGQPHIPRLFARRARQPHSCSSSLLFPAATAAPNSPRKCLSQTVPFPSCSPCVFYAAAFSFASMHFCPIFPIASLNSSWGVKRELAKRVHPTGSLGIQE